MSPKRFPRSEETSRPSERAPLVCVTGPSGSGKTTLVVSILQELRARGLRVAALKHASHGFSMDTPGKDTWRMRKAGAAQVAVVGGGEIALLGDADPAGLAGRDPDPSRLAALLFPGADLVLAEGFSWSAAPRLEVLGEARKPTSPGSGPLLALVDRFDRPARPGEIPATGGPDGRAIPLFQPHETAAVAGFLLEKLGIGQERRRAGGTRGGGISIPRPGREILRGRQAGPAGKTVGRRIELGPRHPSTRNR